jgi:SAM-dependent methyltransferase
VTGVPLGQLVDRLGSSAGALGALGALLRLRAAGAEAHPEVQARLEEVGEELGVRAALDAAGPDELQALASSIRSLLVQALDLVTDPWRAPGWSYTDAELLESQGEESAAFADAVRDSIAPRLEGLAERLSQPSAAVLDVGVGVAGLSVALCRVWPSLRVVGIDPWDPALALARRHVASAGLADRIELRHQRVQDLDDVEAFDLAWLPGPFLPRSVLEAALGRVRAALRPGGWAILALHPAGGGLDGALARLYTVRSGGSVLGEAQATALLAAAGLEPVHVLPAEPWPGTLLVAGRTPA